MEQAHTIELEGLEKRFPSLEKPAVASLTTTLRSGAVIGLVGPDGAGKTTLLRMLAGLLQPSSGKLRVAGLDPIAQDRQLHAILGYMPQKFGLYEDLTVMENLTLYADLRGVTGDLRRQTFERLLKFTDLTRFTERLAGKLSGGMKQKLGLACTLVGEPQVLLLDEPGVGVDPISRRELWRMVHELANDGMLILWSTSYLDEAEQCREVLLLNEGELLFSGAPQELTRRMAGRTVLIAAPPAAIDRCCSGRSACRRSPTGDPGQVSAPDPEGRRRSPAAVAGAGPAGRRTGRSGSALRGCVYRSARRRLPTTARRWRRSCRPSTEQAVKR